ncbi:hypothetical protein ZPAH1_orf00029 [Aeromonas phage ZPAH1]|nr:hypothetical protein ZPAH1_orf00029 [Aeromonas phage ZPAH1]
MKYELNKKYRVVYAKPSFCDVYGVSAGSIVTCHYIDEVGYLYTRDASYQGVAINPYYDHGAWCFAAPKDEDVILELVEEANEKEPALSSIFETSVSLGLPFDSPKRTYDYVMSKCVEELGELSVEVQIENGLSYKERGKDGIAGEAVDLAIAAMDMFALSCGDMEPKEIEKLFLSTMEKKIAKWKEKA